MKTRRSLSSLESVAKMDSSDTPSKRKSLSKVCKTPTSSKKEVNQAAASESRLNLQNSNGNSESSLAPSVYNSPIVRILRSRVVTSDNEDEVKSCRTPKRRLSRGNLKEDKPSDTENDKAPATAETRKSPQSGKKGLSRQNLFSIIEMEENEDTAKSVASVKDKKATSDKDSLSVDEESISKNRIMSEESPKAENANKSASQVKEVRTPTSASKRSSLTPGGRETSSRAERKKEKTLKSFGKKLSFESSLQVAGEDEIEDKLHSIEKVDSVRDGLITHTSPTNTADEFESEKSSVITSDNIERDGGRSDTNEEHVPKERLLDQKPSETECVATESESDSKERMKTPDSAKRRTSFIAENKEWPSKESVKSKSRDKEKERTPASSKKRPAFVMDSNQTPKKVEGKKDKTPKSGKRFSFQDPFKIVRMDEDEDRTNATESMDYHKNSANKFVSSPRETADESDSEKSSVIKTENIGRDGDSSDTSEEYVPKDRLTENKSSETERIDSERKSDSREAVKTPASARKSTFVITENKETASSVERKKKVKTPKSSEKRFSFQDSFKVIEIKEDEDSIGPQKGDLEPSLAISESEETDSHSVSKDSEEEDSEEIAKDRKKKDKMTGKRRSFKMCADESEDSGGSLMQRAMLMTSLAIQKEKINQMKTPQKSEKISDEASSEDESSVVSREVQPEEITEQMDTVKENDSDGASDSDDDLPESMSFDSGKEQMNNAVRMAVEAIRREKERIKEQKRKRMEMIRTQKKEKEQRKMEKLKLLEMKMPKRLSEDVISQLPDIPEIPTIKDTAAKKKKKKKNKMEGRDVEMKESKKNKITRFDDYIPLDAKAATKFGIVPLDVMEKIPKSASEKAAEFKRQALFGSRIRREPSKNLISYKQKIGAAFKSKEVNQQQRFTPY